MGRVGTGKRQEGRGQSSGRGRECSAVNHGGVHRMQVAVHGRLVQRFNQTVEIIYYVGEFMF